MTQAYSSFLTSKVLTVPNAGITVQDSDLHPDAFQFQRDLTGGQSRTAQAGSPGAAVAAEDPAPGAAVEGARMIRQRKPKPLGWWIACEECIYGLAYHVGDRVILCWCEVLAARRPQ